MHEDREEAGSRPSPRVLEVMHDAVLVRIPTSMIWRLIVGDRDVMGMPTRSRIEERLGMGLESAIYALEAARAQAVALRASGIEAGDRPLSPALADEERRKRELRNGSEYKHDAIAREFMRAKERETENRQPPRLTSMQRWELESKARGLATSWRTTQKSCAPSYVPSCRSFSLKHRSRSRSARRRASRRE